MKNILTSKIAVCFVACGALLFLTQCGTSTVEKAQQQSDIVDSLYEVGHKQYEYFRQAASGNPESMKRYYVAATSAFQKALDIDSTHLPSVKELALLLSASKKDSEASNLLRRGLELDSTDAELYMHLGLCQIRLGYVAGGHAILKAALGKDSTNAFRERISAHLTAQADEALMHSWGYPVDGDKRKDYRMFAIANWIISHDVYPQHRDVVENIVALADSLQDEHTVELYSTELENMP